MGEIEDGCDTGNQGSSSTQEEKHYFLPEEKRTEWFDGFETALQPQDVGKATKDVLVMKIPACYRVPSQQYTPKKWIFGLHSREFQKRSDSEDLKIAVAAACKLGEWDDFCPLVVEDPAGVLKAYGLDHGEPVFSKKQVEYLLTLDALTIFFVFAYYASGVPRVDNMDDGVKLVSTRISWGYAHVLIDLFLLENQITLALLKNVITRCYEKWGKEGWTSLFEGIVKANLFEMCGYIFELSEHHQTEIGTAYPQGELEKCPHIVFCVYTILCGRNLGTECGAASVTMPSATALKKAGIQIKGIKGVLDEVCFPKRCLFRKPCLFLPIVKLFDPTESYFRNLAMYEFMENYSSSQLPFGEYLQLMTSLIKEVEDVKHLIDCGVIQNKLGTDNDAFQMWDSLQKELFLPKYSAAYGQMVSKINKKCKSSLNKMKTEFRQRFCSRPWYVVGVITGTIVTVGTFLVAYTSVIGSHKMQPHYPP